LREAAAPLRAFAPSCENPVLETQAVRQSLPNVRNGWKADIEGALATRFAPFKLAPVFLATVDSSGRQISVIFAAVILSPVAITTLVRLRHFITPHF